MKHPPYHLRMNKAVDRFILIDILKNIGKIYDLSKYTYYGFGGPFLEDCKLINQYCPEINLVSIENNKQTLCRQKFHRFTRKLTLKQINCHDFIANFECTGNEIFWLDYTDLTFSRFNEFESLLLKSNIGTIVRITLRADVGSSSPEEDVEAKFRKEFLELLPADFSTKSLRYGEFHHTVQQMLQIASEKVFSIPSGPKFQILNSTYYNDGTKMISLTGIVCDNSDKLKISKQFSKWKFSNLNWRCPDRIDVPILSTKERLKLESKLPNKSKCIGKQLHNSLGYKISDSEKDTIHCLEQYADFCRFYPTFAKIYT